MGLLDRFRRRRDPAAAPEPPVPTSAPPSTTDGGWRAAGPMTPTVRRAPAVSDPLAFRDRLAAWQNPSFRTELGHAVSPAAPSGLGRGLARPRTHTPGAVPPVVQRIPAPRDLPPDTRVPSPDTRVPSSDTRVRPSGGPGPSSGTMADERIEPLAPSRPEAAVVRPAPPSRTLTVARVARPVRRVPTVPPVRPAPGPSGLPPTTPASTPDRPMLGETAAPPGEPDVAVQRAHADSSPLPVVPVPETRKPGLGAPLSGLPVTAQRLTSGPDHRQSTSAAEPPGSPRPARRTTGLGAPLSALPPTAKILDSDTEVPGAEVVQRVTSAPPEGGPVRYRGPGPARPEVGQSTSDAGAGKSGTAPLVPGSEMTRRIAESTVAEPVRHRGESPALPVATPREDEGAPASSTVEGASSPGVSVQRNISGPPQSTQDSGRTGSEGAATSSSGSRRLGAGPDPAASVPRVAPLVSGAGVVQRVAATEAAGSLVGDRPAPELPVVSAHEDDPATPGTSARPAGPASIGEAPIADGERIGPGTPPAPETPRTFEQPGAGQADSSQRASAPLVSGTGSIQRITEGERAEPGAHHPRGHVLPVVPMPEAPVPGTLEPRTRQPESPRRGSAPLVSGTGSIQRLTEGEQAEPGAHHPRGHALPVVSVPEAPGAPGRSGAGQPESPQRGSAPLVSGTGSIQRLTEGEQAGPGAHHHADHALPVVPLPEAPVPGTPEHRTGQPDSSPLVSGTGNIQRLAAGERHIPPAPEPPGAPGQSGAGQADSSQRTSAPLVSGTASIQRLADGERAEPGAHHHADHALPVVPSPEVPAPASSGHPDTPRHGPGRSAPPLSGTSIQRLAETAGSGVAGDTPMAAARRAEPVPTARHPVIRPLLGYRPLTRSVTEPAPAAVSTVDSAAPVRWVRGDVPRGGEAIQRATVRPGRSRPPASRPMPPGAPNRHGAVRSETPVQRNAAGPAPAVAPAPVVPARWVPELPIAAPPREPATIQRDFALPSLSAVTSGLSSLADDAEDSSPGTPIDTPPGTPVSVGAPTETGTDSGDEPTAEHQGMDELARRLVEPVSRLLRADLRAGRERAGRLHPRRR
ncbi:hypothetical protein [Amycolatopsis samaneae]|uniref:Syndecan 1 n=1 Tax=Amycolatopsis samaneae TaxID=664691 RepID=A0ABW5GS69_9PSEU